jgi:hypothetical protein
MRKVLLLICVVALAATFASATNLAPGQNNQTPTLLNPFDFTVNILAVSGPTNFTGYDASNNVAFTGSFETAVVKDATTGYLTFVYEFTTTGGPDSIVRMSSSSFTGFTTEAGYWTDAYFTAMGYGSLAPDTVDRSSNGSVVGFNFFNGVAPGQMTYLLGIHTNAYGYKTGSTQFQDGGVATVKSYAPTVPEPATMTLLASGLLMFGMKRFRK